MKIFDINKTPQNDYIFQKIFASKGNEDMLAEMLEEILGVKIKQINITNEYTINKVYKDTKQSRIDLKVTINDESTVDVELQRADNKNMKDRSIIYGAGLLHEATEEGKDYNDVSKVIVVSILSYNLFEDGDYIVSGRMRRDDNNEVISDKLSVYYIQLPKFIKSKEDKRKKLAQWLYFISQEDKEGLKLAINENEKVARAEKLLKEALSDPETRRILQIKQRARLDRRLDLSQAFKEWKEDTARKMLEEGLPKEQIIRITGIKEEELENLKI